MVENKYDLLKLFRRGKNPHKAVAHMLAFERIYNYDFIDLFQPNDLAATKTMSRVRKTIQRKSRCFFVPDAIEEKTVKEDSKKFYYTIEKRVQ